MKKKTTQSSKEFMLAVKVIPKANRHEIVGWEQEELKIRLSAVPEKGEANTALVAFLAKTLDIAKSQIEIIAGHTSRHKRVRIAGLSEDEVVNQLAKFK